jgi:hypothetical protein
MPAARPTHHTGPAVEEDTRRYSTPTRSPRHLEGVKLLSPPAETQLVRAGLGESKEEEKTDDTLVASYALVFVGSFEEDRVASLSDNNKMVSSEDSPRVCSLSALPSVFPTAEDITACAIVQKKTNSIRLNPGERPGW